MPRLVNRIRNRKMRVKRISFAPAVTSIIVLSAGFFAILQVYSVTTQACADYLNWNLTGYQTGTSLIQAIKMFCLALVAYWVADVLRPKLCRVAFAIRMFQLLLIASMCTVTFIQWGMLMPRAPHADVARQVQLALAETPFFQIEFFVLVDSAYEFPLPHSRREVMADNSPFLIKAGELSCQVQQDAEQRWLEQWNAQSGYARPFAVTDLPE